MTQLRRDAAYVRTKSAPPSSMQLSDFDDRVCKVLSTPHTVVSAAKALSQSNEDAVAESMWRLLEAERIELSPDS